VRGGNQRASIAREIAVLRKLTAEIGVRLEALAKRVSEISTANEYVTVIPPDALNASINLHDRIVLLLDANPQTEFSPLGVQEALPNVNLNSIRSALIRLVQEYRIRRPRRAWYTSVHMI
jgi:hypothetical protein